MMARTGDTALTVLAEAIENFKSKKHTPQAIHLKKPTVSCCELVLNLWDVMQNKDGGYFLAGK